MTRNSISESSKHSMVTRIITATVLIGVLAPCTIFGGWAFFVLIAFLSIVAIYEILKTPGPQRYPVYVMVVVYLFLLGMIFWNFASNWVGAPNPTNGGRFSLNFIYLSLLALLCYGLTLFLIAIISPKVQLADVTYLFTVGFVIVAGFLGIFFCRYFGNATGITTFPGLYVNPSWSTLPVAASDYFTAFYEAHGVNQNLASCILLMFIAGGTWGSDVGAYFFGMLFGKHKMNPRISPHKTWEGFFGGMFVGWGLSLGLAALMEFVFNQPLIPGLLQFRYSALLDGMGVLHGQAWPFIVCVGFLLPTVGNIGGFLFSLIKRQYGIKDYGKIFPGHGGVIDRFDSMLINCACVAFVLILTMNGWNIFR